MISPDSSFPVFVVSKLKEAKQFYSNHFSFSVVFENDWYVHLVSKSGIQIGFLLPNHPTQPEMFQKEFSGDGVIFSLEVTDADTAYAEAQENNLDIVLDLRSEEWGQRHFCIKDPNGLYLDIVQATEPAAAYQEGYVTQSDNTKKA